MREPGYGGKGIKIGTKQNGKETVGYGRKSVSVRDVLAGKIKSAWSKALSSASKFGSMIK